MLFYGLVDCGHLHRVDATQIFREGVPLVAPGWLPSGAPFPCYDPIDAQAGVSLRLLVGYGDAAPSNVSPPVWGADMRMAETPVNRGSHSEVVG